MAALRAAPKVEPPAVGCQALDASRTARRDGRIDGVFVGQRPVLPVDEKPPAASAAEGPRTPPRPATDLGEPLDELESLVGDLAPGTVDDERVATVRHLD